MAMRQPWAGRWATITACGLVAPTPALAGDANWDWLGNLLVGGPIGALVALGLLLWLARPSKGVHWLACILVGAVVVPLGAWLGAAILGGASGLMTGSRRQSQVQENQAFLASGLRARLCDGDAAHAATPLVALAKRESRANVGRAAAECLVARPQSAANAEALAVLMTVIADGRPSQRRGVDDVYCATLDQLHQQAHAAAVRALHQAGLPVVCPGTKSQPWDLPAAALGDEDRAFDPALNLRRLDWLKAVQEAVADLPRLVLSTGEGIGHAAARCGHPGLLQFMLDLGAAPTSAAHSNEHSIRTLWLVRGFRPAKPMCDLNLVDDAAGRATIQAINGRIGPLSAAEINDASRVRTDGSDQLEAPVLWAVKWVNLEARAQELDAPLLAFLMQHGARLDVRDSHGQTFLHDAPVLTPQALALVAGAPPAQLAALGQQVVGWRTRKLAPALVDEARKRGDAALVQLLCRHGAVGC